MAKQIIRTPDAPSSQFFSQAVKVDATVYVSGIVGIDPRTNQLAGTTIQEQTRQALLNCEAILHSAGAKLEHVVDVLVLANERVPLARVTHTAIYVPRQLAEAA